MKTFIIVVFSVALVAVGLACAQDTSLNEMKRITLPTVTIELTPGTGKDKVEILCNICHSLDYITTQPKALKSQWTATVNKMIKVMGAPITETDARVILDYLAANYGTR